MTRRADREAIHGRRLAGCRSSAAVFGRCGRRCGRQFVRRRDGREVVVVSREYFEETKPNLKSYLVGSGYAGKGDDAFHVAMQGARTEGSLFLRPRNVDLKD